MKKTFLLILSFLFLTSLVFGQEVLLNGDFESWDDVNTPTSWTHVENITQETTVELVHGGTYSAQHIGGTKDLGQTISGIVAGDDYDLSLWYKVTAGDGDDVRIWSYWKNGTTSLSDNAAELRTDYFDNNGGAWTSYSVSVTAPATADNFYFEVRTYNGATVYWDDFSFNHVISSTPTITLSTTSLTNFTYVVGNGPSAEQSFTAQGSNLTADISITAPTNYEISETSGSGYTSPITLTQSGGSVSESTIYVRLKSGLSVGDYNNEDITATSTGATNKTVSCDGNVTATTPVEPTAGDLIINEVNSTSNYNAVYAELYNLTSSIINLNNIDLEHYNNGAATTTAIVNLTGTVAPHEYIVITKVNTDFNSVYSFNADFELSTMYLNGGTDGLILRSDVNGVLDQFNDVPSATGSWTDNHLFNRANYPNDGSNLSLHWIDIGANEEGTPGAVNNTPLPVTLSSFTALFSNDTPIIEWVTESESNNLGWNVYRANSSNLGQASILNINTIPGNGTTSEPSYYSFVDEYEVQENFIYWYWLESIAISGDTEMFGPVALTIPLDDNQIQEIPTVTELHQNFPNPFNPNTSISFDIKEGEDGVLTIYNFKGQIIEKQMMNAGEYTFEWDGTAYGSGVYLYKLETDSYTETKKMIMLK